MEGEKEGFQRLDAITDPVLRKGLKNEPGFVSRLAGVNSYDDILEAVEKAAVEDEHGEMIVFDIEGYDEGYEDEEITATSLPLEELKAAIVFIKENGVKHGDGIRDLVHNINVTNAVKSVWARELPLTEEQITTDEHE